MTSRTHAPPARTRRNLAATVAGLLTLALAGIAGPVLAGEPSKPVIAERQNPQCGPGQTALQRAGDRFAQGCLPGERIAQLNDSGATLQPGETASSPNMRLVANLPKSGAFAGESA